MAYCASGHTDPYGDHYIYSVLQVEEPWKGGGSGCFLVEVRPEVCSAAAVETC